VRKVVRSGSSTAKELAILRMQIWMNSRFTSAVLNSFTRWCNGDSRLQIPSERL
jgi:hypothetical protein